MKRLSQRIPYGCFAVLLVLDVLALLAEKMAALQSSGTGLVFYASLAKQVWTWLGLGLGPLQLWVWTRILARTELSVAYPLSNFSYPLTMIAAELVFREQLNGAVWLGALLITVGIAIVSRGATDHETLQPPLPF